jgi:hypothetical protein
MYADANVARGDVGSILKDMKLAESMNIAGMSHSNALFFFVSYGTQKYQP